MGVLGLCLGPSVRQRRSQVVSFSTPPKRAKTGDTPPPSPLTPAEGWIS